METRDFFTEYVSLGSDCFSRKQRLSDKMERKRATETCKKKNSLFLSFSKNNENRGILFILTSVDFQLITWRYVSKNTEIVLNSKKLSP
jgi:cysteine sulfinate desulfinase/cysteine desulfurase-like protein